jgi:hypothetical protein
MKLQENGGDDDEDGEAGDEAGLFGALWVFDEEPELPLKQMWGHDLLSINNQTLVLSEFFDDLVSETKESDFIFKDFDWDRERTNELISGLEVVEDCFEARPMAIEIVFVRFWAVVPEATGRVPFKEERTW